MKYEATLIEGGTYSCFGEKFERDIPHPKLLTEQQKRYLDANAIFARKTRDGQRVETCMFRFEERPEPADYAADELDTPVQLASGTGAGNTDPNAAPGAGNDGTDDGDQTDAGNPDDANGDGEGDGTGADGGQEGEADNEGGADNAGQTANTDAPNVRQRRR